MNPMPPCLVGSTIERDASSHPVAERRGVGAGPPCGREDKDACHAWFDELERMGESFRIRLGRYRRGMDEPEWFFLPHQQFDGLGGLAHILRATANAEVALPQLTRDERPSLFARWTAAVRLLCRRPARPRPWQVRQPGPIRAGRAVFAWTLFTTAETVALRAAARDCGVSLNAWLLCGLAQSCLPRLASGGGDAAWIVPINMRGALPCRRDTANLASILDVAFPLPATPLAVHAALAAERRRLGHFGAWQLLQMVGHLPPRLRRAVVRHEAKVAKHGCFSNLGQLKPGDCVALDTHDWWLAFNPVIQARPVGMACLTWHGRMAATLQLHPALGCSENDARGWLSSWREIVLPPDGRNASQVQPRCQCDETALPRRTRWRTK